MQLTVFGASGRTGVPLVEQALAAGHEVTAFVRDRSRLPVEDERLSVVEGDAYTGEGVDDVVPGADAVVSVHGQSSSGPDDLLTVAGGQVVDSMERAGVERFVTLVGPGVRVEGESMSVFGRVMSAALKLMAREVLEDAKNHVADVRSRDRRWTVVRLPRLILPAIPHRRTSPPQGGEYRYERRAGSMSEAEPGGEYRTGDVTPGRAAVARADVASLLLEVVSADSYVESLPRITY